MGMNSISFGAEQSSWIRVTPMRTMKTITRAQGHNNRTNKNEINRSGHIKSDLSVKNEYLVGSENDDFYRMAVEDITGHAYIDEEWEDAKVDKGDLRYMFGDKVRKDAVLLAEAEARFPGAIHIAQDGGWEADSPEEFEKWKNETLAFMKDRFKEENIKSAVIHMDEGRPHMHVIFTPIYENEKGEKRLNYNKFIKGPNDLRKLGREYADRIGYEPGVIMSQVKSVPRKEIEKRMQLAVSEHLPEPEPGQDAKTYHDEIAEPQFEAANLKRADAELKAKRYINTHREAKAKDKVIERQRTQISELTHQLELMELELKQIRLREEAEEIGANTHPDQDMINEIYRPLKESLISSGQEHMRVVEHTEDEIKEQEEIEKDKEEYPNRVDRDAFEL